MNSLINLASVFACLFKVPVCTPLSSNPFHLKQFAKYHQYTGATYGKYKRPQRDMFMDHTHQQIHDYNLNMCHRQGKVSHIRKQQSQWQLELQDGTLLIQIVWY